MISNYRDLLPLVMPELPGCPDVLVMQYLRDTGRTLCRDTEAWRVDVTMNIVADQEDYILVPDWEAEIRRIIEVKLDGEDGTEISHEDFDFDQRNNTLTLKYPPSADLTDGLVATVALVPYLYADELAGWFMERWSDAIVAGCKSVLMMQPKKMWTNFQRGQKYAYDASNAIALARFEIRGKNKRVVTSAQSPEWL